MYKKIPLTHSEAEGGFIRRLLLTPSISKGKGSPPGFFVSPEQGNGPASSFPLPSPPVRPIGSRPRFSNLAESPSRLGFLDLRVFRVYLHLGPPTGLGELSFPHCLRFLRVSADSEPTLRHIFAPNQFSEKAKSPATITT